MKEGTVSDSWEEEIGMRCMKSLKGKIHEKFVNMQRGSTLSLIIHDHLLLP